jgi:amino acid adenylation domain-containing protein
MALDLNSTIFDIFADVAARQGYKTAVDDGEHYFTYAELHEDALGLARRIAAVVAPGAPVGIILPTGATFPVAVLAALAAGCPFVALDPSFPEARNTFIVKHAGMKAIVVDAITRGLAKRLDPAMPQIDLAASAHEGTAGLPPGSPDDVAVICYTSGSTGQPKGVVHTQRNLLHYVVQRLDMTHLGADDRVALPMGTTVMFATKDILSGLLSGATLFIVDLRRSGLQELVRVLRRGKITTLRTVPVVMRQLTKLCRDPDVFASLRHVFLSSDRLFSADVELLRRVLPPNCRLSASMGSTETQLITHWFIDRNRPMKEAIVPVGYVQPNFQVTLVDDCGRPLPPGEIGEIVVTSRYLALGYWQDETETKRCFSPDPGDSQARTFRTGDVGRMNAEGLLEFIGRKDRRIKIRGNRVEPLEVEATICVHHQVRDAAVVIRHQRDNIELVAYVSTDTAGSLTADGLSAWLAERLPDAMRPRQIYLIDEIPMLGNFKHDIRALEELDRKHVGVPTSNRSPTVEMVAGQTAAARDAVYAAWAHLLGVEAVNEDKTWEAAGGDSLKALELMFALEAALGRRISMRFIGPLTRPSHLIARLRSAEPLGGGAAATEARPLLFLLPWSGGYSLGMVRFADALSTAAKVEGLEYAPIDPAALRVIRLDDLVADTIEPIRLAAQRGEPVRVLGCSLGGFVAIEIARILLAEGRVVEFVGLLDTSTAPLRWDFDNTDPERVPAHIARRVDQPILARILRVIRKGRLLRVRPAAVFRRVFEKLLLRGNFAALSSLWWLLTLLHLRKTCAQFRAIANQFLNGMAVIKAGRPVYYPGRLILFRSEDPEWDRLNMPDDLGWNQYCAEVSVRWVPGDHISMIAAANVEATTRTVIQALREKHAGNDSSLTQRTSDYVTALPIGHRGEHL